MVKEEYAGYLSSLSKGLKNLDEVSGAITKFIQVVWYGDHMYAVFL